MTLPPIKIDADALFRAVSATGYKLLAYTLNLETGAIESRTLRPDEISFNPHVSNVKPLPKMGGDLRVKKEPLFGSVPVENTREKKLFGDDSNPKNAVFEGEFWKRQEEQKPNLFSEGFRRESGARKLAEIFGDSKKQKPKNPFSGTQSPQDLTGNVGQSATLPAVAPMVVAPANTAPGTGSELEKHPRIPAATEQQQHAWMLNFAKQSGDPEIREQMYSALKNARPHVMFDMVLRRHQRTGQQWERYFRKQSLAFGEAWLSSLGIKWELLESEHL